MSRGGRRRRRPPLAKRAGDRREVSAKRRRSSAAPTGTRWRPKGGEREAAAVASKRRPSMGRTGLNAKRASGPIGHPTAEGALTQKPWRRPIFPKGCPLSIFGAGELNFRVRDGNGCGLSARVTRVLCVWMWSEQIARELNRVRFRQDGRTSGAAAVTADLQDRESCAGNHPDYGTEPLGKVL
jgi:hypothetical protein